MPDENLIEESEIAVAEAEAAPANEEEQNLEATGDDQEEQEAETPADDDAGAPGKKGAQRRIRQLTKKFRNAEREVAAERAARLAQEERLKALEARLGSNEPVRPTRAEFDSDEDYEDALFDWRDKTRQTKQESTPAAQEVNPATAEFEEELDDFSDDAYDLVMNTDWPCNQTMTDYIMISDNRAALATHLASNKEIAGKIAKLSPVLAVRELEKVERSLSTKPGAQKEQLAPPITTGKPGGGVGTNPEKLSTKQWVELRRQGKI